MRDRLHYYQYGFLTAVFSAAGMFLPGAVRGTAGTGAFAAFLISALPGTAFIALAAAVFRRGKGPMNALSASAGKGPARAALLIFAAYFLFSAARLMAFYSAYAASSAQMLLPALFLLPVMAGICFAAAGSVSSLGRLAVLTGGGIALATAIFLVFSVFAGKTEDLFPIVSVPPDVLFTVTVNLSSFQYAEALAALCLSGALTERRRLIGVSVVSALAGNAVVIITAFLSVFLNGPSVSVNGMPYIASYAVVSDTALLKVIAGAALFFAAAFRTAVLIKAAAVCAADALSIKKYRGIAVISSAAVYAAAVLMMTSTTKLADDMVSRGWVYAAIPVFAVAAAFTAGAVKKIRAKVR